MRGGGGGGRPAVLQFSHSFFRLARFCAPTFIHTTRFLHCAHPFPLARHGHSPLSFSHRHSFSDDLTSIGRGLARLVLQRRWLWVLFVTGWEERCLRWGHADPGERSACPRDCTELPGRSAENCGTFWAEACRARRARAGVITRGVRAVNLTEANAEGRSSCLPSSPCPPRSLVSVAQHLTHLSQTK